MAQISIIIVNYNTKDLLDRCLASIQEPAEIIVVDNASSDTSSQMVAKKYPKVKLIASSTNLGFAAGNNLGMQQATGDYLLLLNSDAFLQKDTLTKCLNYDFDVFGCKLTFEDGSLQPSAGYLPNPINSFLWIWGIDTWPILKNMLPMVHPKNSGFFAKSKPIGWVTGAFMFMKRSVFEKTGGFDEKYFMYGEEIEWCKRINDAGFKVGYIADFSIVHLQGASQPNRDRAFVNELQGLIYYFKKHYSFWPMRFIIKWGSLARIIAFKIAGKPDRAVVYKQIFSTI